MIKLSRMTDYAIVILSQIAKSEGGLCTVSQIAQKTHLPATAIAKVMQVLVSRKTLIGSQQGSYGGYFLLRPPEQISIGEVIEIFEGPIALTVCVKGIDKICDIEKVCLIYGKWERVNTEIRNTLYRLCLSDLLAPEESSEESSLSPTETLVSPPINPFPKLINRKEY